MAGLVEFFFDYVSPYAHLFGEQAACGAPGSDRDEAHRDPRGDEAGKQSALTQVPAKGEIRRARREAMGRSGIVTSSK